MRMKGWCVIAGAMLSALVLMACGKKETMGEAPNKVALITDLGTLDDESFNQASWEGIVSYCEANDIEYTYFQPKDDSYDERFSKIDDAVANGYHTIVMSGYLFAKVVSDAQKYYEDVRFIVVDVAESDLTCPPEENLCTIVFCEEEAGFLAGYSMVKEGYRHGGYLGGVARPAVIRFGYGFLYGMDYAAREMGLDDVTCNYTYGGQFFGDASITAKMESWYASGTEVVFAAGGGIWTSAAEAAVLYDGMIIGVDVDQHAFGEDKEKYPYNPFLTSAMKDVSLAINSALDASFNGSWDEYGGKCVFMSLKEGNYIGLPTKEESWCFKKFTKEEYEEVREKINSGEIVVEKIQDVNARPTYTNLKVNYIQ